MPAHILLNHFIIVLAPLTALLAVLVVVASVAVLVQVYRIGESGARAAWGDFAATAIR